jgi:hypothetical protein
MSELFIQDVTVAAKIFRDRGGGLSSPTFHQRVKKALRT